MFTPPNNLSDSAGLNNQPMGEEIPDADIHTMPDKFLNPLQTPAEKGKINWVILGTVIFLALAGVIVAVVLFLNREASPAEPEINLNAALKNLNQNNANTANLNQNQNVNANQNQAVPQSSYDLSTVAGRDAQRLTDIQNIRTALSLYYKTYNLFPQSLISLVDKGFLKQLPRDPINADYLYNATTDQLNYHLEFTLEGTGNLGILILPAGTYVATSLEVTPKSAGNQNANQNANQNTNQLPVPPVVNKPGPGLDSDNDGLTDIEENLYGTDANKADTAGSGYSDSTNLLNFYDPTHKGQRLVGSGLVSVYQNLYFKYSLLYPAKWSTRSLGDNNKEVVFTANTGEFFDLAESDNAANLSSYQWLVSQNPQANITQYKNLTIHNLPAIQSPDGLTTYIFVGNKVFTLTYNVGNNQQMNFNTTYQLFVKSFMLMQ